MAKKKVSSRERAQSEVSLQEKPHSAMEDPSAKLSSLKSLNALLVKEAFERRQQVDTLLQSNEALESEICRLVDERRRLEGEKDRFEEQMMKGDVEKRLELFFVSSQLNQQVEELRERIRRGDEEVRVRDDVLKAEMEKKIGDEAKRREEAEMKVKEMKREIDQVTKDFSRYRCEAREDLGQKQEEADRLRSVVAELEKSNKERCEVIKRMQMKYDSVVQETVDMEGRLEDLERQMKMVVTERNDLEQTKIERDLEIFELKKSVDSFTSDLHLERALSNEVAREKVLLDQSLDRQIREAERLKAKLFELETSNSQVLEDVQKLQMEKKQLLEERKERKKNFALMMQDKDLVERSQAESSKLIEDLKREISELDADKQETERERAKHALKVTDLQKEVNQLCSTISALQKEEEGLRLKVSELGISNEEAMEKNDHLRAEVSSLMEELMERERRFENLMEEKISTTRDLEEHKHKLEEGRRKTQDTVKAKAEIEQAKIKLEVELIEQQEKVGELRDIVSALQESCRDLTATNNRLQSEVHDYTDVTERVSLERDDARAELDQEKKGAESLRLRILELEKSVDETSEELRKLQSEYEGLVEEKVEMGKRFELVMEEKASAERSLTEAQLCVEDLQAKKKSAEIISEQALVMVKNTVAELCGSGDDKWDELKKGDIDVGKIEAEIRPYAVEMGTIKRAFRNRDAEMEDMARKLECLQKSVVEARKRRNFWTCLSSATIFVAASVAYVARGRN